MGSLYWQEQPDEALAKATQEGDASAFAVLVRRYEAKMLRYANKFLPRHEDRQDAVQDVFLKAYQNMKSYDPSRPFSPWLYRVAHNTFITLLKKSGREELSSFDSDTFFAATIADEHEETVRERKEIREILDKSMDKIDAKYREVLVLHYFEDKSYEEIAEILQMPVATVGVRLSRGRKMLKEVIMNQA